MLKLPLSVNPMGSKLRWCALLPVTHTTDSMFGDTQQSDVSDINPSCCANNFCVPARISSHVIVLESIKDLRLKSGAWLFKIRLYSWNSRSSTSAKLRFPTTTSLVKIASAFLHVGSSRGSTKTISSGAFSEPGPAYSPFFTFSLSTLCRCSLCSLILVVFPLCMQMTLLHPSMQHSALPAAILRKMFHASETLLFRLC